MVSPEEVNNDGAGWGWTGMEVAQVVPTPGLPAAAGDSTTYGMKVLKIRLVCSPGLHILSLWVTSGEQGTEEQGQAVLLHRRTITPALGLKPWPTSVLPPLEGNISPPQPAPSPPFQSGNSQCVPSINAE